MPPYTPAEITGFTVDLKPGEEWHSEPYDLKDGDQVTLSCGGDGRFYAGIFDREEYFAKRGAGGGAFDFEFGEDRRGFTDRFVVPDDDEYYIVLRVGVFTGRPVRINVRLKIQRG